MMILVVEDDVEIRCGVAELLRDEGHETWEAPNGAAALAWLEAATVLPGLILLDLMMPVMDGWELRRRLLRDERLKEVPVVVMSGAADVKGEALALGAAVLLKPFDGAALSEAIAPFFAAR